MNLPKIGSLISMAKIYDYFTQTIHDVFDEEGIEADYIDIKGDGVFGIFEGDNAVFRALVAAATFSTFFRKKIRPKFQDIDQPMNFKAAIHIDKILVKRLGKRGPRNNNEVWAGRLINKAAKLAAKTEDIYKADEKFKDTELGLLVFSEKVYEALSLKPNEALMTCGHDMSGNTAVAASAWDSLDTSDDENLSEEKVYYGPAIQCIHCGDKVAEEFLA
jgi:hypothetical protein